MGVIEVELNALSTIDIALNSSNPLDVNLGQSGVTIRDYEKLYNKPQINNVTLVGNLFLNDIFPDGIIINGGDSTGYDPIPIPSDVPRAKGAGF